MKIQSPLSGLVTGLATFLIGCLVSGLFTEAKTYPESTTKGETKKIEFKPMRWEGQGKQFTREPTPEPVAPLPTMPFCNDKNILPIWNQIRRKAKSDDWRISIKRHGIADCSQLLDVMYFDLDGKGVNEILVRAKYGPFCGANGNCSFWIFRKEGKRYKGILETGDYVDISMIGDQILRTKSKGYNDILVKFHLSSSDTSYVTYEFNGRTYVLRSEFVEAYFGKDNGEEYWKFISAKEYLERGFYRCYRNCRR